MCFTLPTISAENFSPPTPPLPRPCHLRHTRSSAGNVVEGQEAHLERDDLVAFLSLTDSELEDTALRLKSDLRTRHHLDITTGLARLGHGGTSAYHEVHGKQRRLERLTGMLNKSCRKDRSGMTLPHFNFLLKCVGEFLTDEETERVVAQCIDSDPNHRARCGVPGHSDAHSLALPDSMAVTCSHLILLPSRTPALAAHTGVRSASLDSSNSLRAVARLPRRPPVIPPWMPRGPTPDQQGCFVVHWVCLRSWQPPAPPTRWVSRGQQGPKPAYSHCCASAAPSPRRADCETRQTTTTGATVCTAHGTISSLGSATATQDWRAKAAAVATTTATATAVKSTTAVAASCSRKTPSSRSSSAGECCYVVFSVRGNLVRPRKRIYHTLSSFLRLFAAHGTTTGAMAASDKDRCAFRSAKRSSSACSSHRPTRSEVSRRHNS